MARPIKIPAGATHAEPSWRERLKQVAEDYAAKGGAKGIWQRALSDFLAWRGPSGSAPAILQKAEVDHPVSRRTNLGNAYIGKKGVWLEQECATGQVLYIWVPDINSLSDKSILRRDFVVQVEEGHRFNYAPATVMGVLRLGYPQG